MSDLIRREEVLKKLSYEMKHGAVFDKSGLDTAYDIIKNIQSAEQETAKVECIAEVYKNEIVDHYLSGICEICGESTYDRAKYCSWCGARLDWSDDE